MQGSLCTLLFNRKKATMLPAKIRILAYIPRSFERMNGLHTLARVPARLYSLHMPFTARWATFLASDSDTTLLSS
jgi:hypothetical protein